MSKFKVLRYSSKEELVIEQEYGKPRASIDEIGTKVYEGDSYLLKHDDVTGFIKMEEQEPEPKKVQVESDQPL